MVDRDPISKVQRRVVGYHDVRMDGMHDLVLRARGMSVFDVGCNRGMVGFEFAVNGASLVHGCDNYEKGIDTAREVFADLRYVRSQFEVVDLAKGPEALEVFGGQVYNLVLLLAIVHKLKRIMPEDALFELLVHFGKMSDCYVGGHIQEVDFPLVHKAMMAAGFRLVHTSQMSEELGPAYIWKRT